MSGNFIHNEDVLVKDSIISDSFAPQSGSAKFSQPNGGTNGSASVTTTETTPVYYWYFDSPSTESTIPAYSQNMPSVHSDGANSVESVVNSVDGRVQVNTNDYQVADGQFRAIVKLFLLYDGQTSSGVTEDEATWAIATGWLIAGDLVVTAGHCAYDYSHNLGRLIKVKAYVGYNGKDSIGTDAVEFRYGSAIATTEGWINTDGGNEPRDVSMIKLESPFTTVKSYCKWKQTPISENAADLGVVGYPGDIVNDKGERGATMYKMFRQTNYDLNSSKLHMLQYQIDTYGGNSGSPVFCDRNSLLVIGVHVLGGYAFNSASVITGPYGNRLLAMRNVTKDLDGTYPKDATQPDKAKRPWLWMSRAITTESAANDPVYIGLKATIAKARSVHADIPSTILDSDKPISFGSDAGAQMGILASAAIATAGRLAADSVNGSNAEALASTRPYDGVLGRAILAETALQCFFELSASSQETFTEFLGPVVASLTPFCMKVAPKLLKGILEPSMRLLLSNMNVKLDDNNKRDTRADAAETDTGFGRKLTDNETVFMNGLLSKVDHSAVESFYSTFTTIGDVIGSAFKKAGPVLLDVAKFGLPLLLETDTGASQPQTNLDPLAHRAILAEACLQAYIAMPETDKRKSGLYSKIVNKLKNLGPKLVKASPFMVKFVAPIVADILREADVKKKQEFLDFTWGGGSKS
ncbi:hypothetical protein TWF694_011603 [Orbilia ellipsospora]|uniref:Serine protease n=1 Tax=Orbilia ellipsospora TaxID=2528407 RepID=A0AAV9X6Y9_9PEZI